MIQNGEDGVIKSPTSSGKTYTVSTTRWRDRPDITDGQPVILLSGTTDARNDAVKKSDNSSVDAEVLCGRHDVCPLAGGEYDSGNNQEDTAITAPDGSEPSEWFESMCDGRGLPVSIAHGEFERSHSGDLPCCEDGPCQSKSQWENVPRTESGEVEYDILHATHTFARVPQLVEDCNVIIDEQPDFTIDLGGQLQRVVTSYLGTIDTKIKKWEHLISDLERGQVPADITDSLEQPDSGWFQNNRDAHALAPGITEAIVNAEKRNHRRWVGEASYTYPTLTPQYDGPRHEVTIRFVMDNENNEHLLQVVPDFSRARCVVGLDAYPTMPKWRGNTLQHLKLKRIVDSEELHEWRRNQRNLTIVQVGDNKNTWTRNGFHHDKVEILSRELRNEYGDDFTTGIAPFTFESDFVEILQNIGVEDYQTIHFGNAKSVEDFDSEEVGLIAGCISPSSDTIKNWLALLNKDADPKREGDNNYQGQEWVGEDADIAEEILADVQQKEVLQACGRYARSPEQTDDKAIVFVLTNILPKQYVDRTIPDVRPLGEKQKQILNYIYSSDGTTPKEIVQNTNAGSRHVYKTVKILRDYSWLRVEEKSGNEGNIYYANRRPDGLIKI